MSSWKPVAASLLAGVLVGGVAVVALAAFAPDIAQRLEPSPAVAASAGAVASVGPATGGTAPNGGTPSSGPASGSPSASGSARSSASAAASAASSATPVGSDGPFRIGQPAPALSLTTVGGGSIDLTSLRGKPVWVNFMATYCPPCRDEFPLMNGYATRFADKGLTIIAVDVREDSATAAAFARQLNTQFPVGLDTDGSAERAWRVAALPTHFWIDANGIIRDGALGGLGPDVMAQGLSTILPGVDLTP